LLGETIKDEGAGIEGWSARGYSAFEQGEINEGLMQIKRSCIKHGNFDFA
jgi:hypothetical protein